MIQNNKPVRYPPGLLYWFVKFWAAPRDGIDPKAKQRRNSYALAEPVAY